ncbi:MAG: RagB/SusD family nutrient uptake outer membrane protein [Bacteroidetes bacterium]|nr:RagB/SusD family nutrient uptake outer membrane protein [Bacteroidota bacterium]
MKNIKQIFLITACITGSLFGCKKMIEVDTPQNQLTADKVFADTTATEAAMVNVYALFDKTIDPNYNKWMGLYTDELIYPNATSNSFLTSNLATNDATVLNIWKNNYFAIYGCNNIIGQLKDSRSIKTSKAASYTVEAKFLRAYAYFYLINSFGSVPLLLTTDVQLNSNATQADSATVYRQIIADLTDAQAGLPAAYADGNKVRATKWAATALLARVYLYQRNWTAAESAASSVINSGLYSLPDPANVFLANSPEAILQIWTQNGYANDAASLIPRSGRPTYPVSDTLLNAFENGDTRKTDWLRSTVAGGSTYFYPYKYHNHAVNVATPEYLMVLRLAEQYLIRAEARAQEGNITGAIDDVNTIRQRAGLPPLASTLSPAQIFDAIMQEWRIEFFMEWGHRYLDLKRTGRLNTYMGGYKSTWSAKSVLLPIPQNEITNDHNLLQNKGY